MPTVRYTVMDGEIVSENRNGTVRDYVPDPLGSTIALLDQNQNITDTFSYWPYGEERTRTGTTPTPFRFVGTLGYYRDSSGRTYVRAREYQQTYGRWMTVDPLWPRQASYEYVGSSPLAFTDRTGRCWCAFRGSVGRVNVDCSCAGRLPIWIVTEEGHVYTAPCCNQTIEADGFIIGGKTYKIDGSVCVDIFCELDRSGNVTWRWDACVNHLASCLGKREPYRVPSGSIGNQGEPPGPPYRPHPPRRC